MGPECGQGIKVSAVQLQGEMINVTRCNDV